MSCDIRQSIRTGRGANLIVDDCKAVSLLRQSQHNLSKVTATRSINPAGTEYQVRAIRFADGVLAFQLGFPVNTQRAGGISFHPRLIAAAVKHIVGRVMNQPRPTTLGFLRQYAWSECVDGMS